MNCLKVVYLFKFWYIIEVVFNTLSISLLGSTPTVNFIFYQEVRFYWTYLPKDKINYRLLLGRAKTVVRLRITNAVIRIESEKAAISSVLGVGAYHQTTFCVHQFSCQ